MKLGFLASHGGSGMAAILDAAARGELGAAGVLMISNNEKAGAHGVAAGFGVPSMVLNAKRAGGEEALDRAIAAALDAAGAEWVILSGYMRLLGPAVLSRFSGRILNIHPALLPKFGGKGMYGDFVHEAVLAAGEAESGATVHFVDEQYDHGAALAQARCPVSPDDSLETLRARVRALEGPLYVATLKAIATGQIKVK